MPDARQFDFTITGGFGAIAAEFARLLGNDYGRSGNELHWISPDYATDGAVIAGWSATLNETEFVVFHRASITPPLGVLSAIGLARLARLDVSIYTKEVPSS